MNEIYRLPLRTAKRQSVVRNPVSTVTIACAIATLICLIPTAKTFAQESNFQTNDIRPSQQTSRLINEETRWSFRAKTDVEIGTAVIRLGDIVEPIDPNLPAWPRLARSTIGLVPVGGQNMVIDRERLTRIMLSLEATPRRIEWLGAQKINVRYRKGAPKFNADRQAGSSPIRQVDYVDGPNERSRQFDTIDQPRMTSTEARRAIGWAKMAIKRYVPEVAAGFSYEIPEDQAALVPLTEVGGITDCQPLNDVVSGDCLFRITARGYDGIKTTDLLVKLSAHPLVVVPTRALGRGQRVTAADLKLAPIASDRLDSDTIDDPSLIVGMEVRTPLRTGRPVRQSDVGAPVLIHRGDLIEVRVLGGGIQVTTNAKALSNGAASELIEIETIEPRKRIVARVAEVGIAEIVTRAPVVR